MAAVKTVVGSGLVGDGRPISARGSRMRRRVGVPDGKRQKVATSNTRLLRTEGCMTPSDLHQLYTPYCRAARKAGPDGRYVLSRDGLVAWDRTPAYHVHSCLCAIS
jgi:hypothetical protein